MGRLVLSASCPLSGRPCAHTPSVRRGGWGPSTLRLMPSFLQQALKPSGLSLQGPQPLCSDSYLILIIYTFLYL